MLELFVIYRFAIQFWIFFMFVAFSIHKTYHQDT